MQMDEILAQDGRHQASEVLTSSLQRAADLALSSRETRRSGVGMRSSQQVVVLLVRKTHQGKQPMGQHDEAGDDCGSSLIFPERSTSRKSLDLSTGERWLIWRRRETISQSQVAESVNLPRRRYSEFELGIGNYVLHLDAPAVDNLTEAEKCFIWRRRSGWTQQACADLMGITRYWYNLMENGKVTSEKLEAFWNEG